ncbi:hypothetical protein PV327_009164 [Microctonus hyperodae]|uniref:Uncharacterized protein n=1 Tax=Microctonus hyperodae TaxID=165561 RepID=A0AA39FTH5_MICHY|nr:hypothetical protein PV327_009164 [Microctonus hyperodae]
MAVAADCLSVYGMCHKIYVRGLAYNLDCVRRQGMVVVSIKLEPLGERCRGPRNDNAARRKHVYVQGVAL